MQTSVANNTVGDQYPSAHVRGIDMSPIQPVWVPPNVDFLVDDCTSEWLATNVDLVHFRFMVMILRDVPSVMKHCYKQVYPSTRECCEEAKKMQRTGLTIDHEQESKAWRLGRNAGTAW